MVWNCPREEVAQLIQTFLSELILLVSYRFEIFQAAESFENATKLFATDATVTKQNPIQLCVFHKTQRLCKSSAVTLSH